MAEREGGQWQGRWPGAVARAAYLGVLALATLSSLGLDLDPSAVADRLRRMLIPAFSARDAIDAARNVALFAGWGLVWALTTPAERSRRGAVTGAAVTGAVISLTVELAQLLSWTRRASVLDVATNTLGALVGAAMVALALGALEGRRGRRSFLGVPALAFAAAYAAAVLGEAFVPLFRQGPVPGASGGPLRRFAAAAERFDVASLLAMPLTDLLVFLPAGALAVAALVEEGSSRRRAAVWTVAGALVLLPIAEVAHGFLGAPMSAGAALLHVLAVGAGALLAAALLPRFTRRWRGPDRPRAVLAAYAGILFLWALRPYRLAADPASLLEQLRGGWWIPLRAVAVRMDVFSVIDVLNGFLLFLPLGALLAVWPLRRDGGVWAGLLPALYLAAAVELAQLLVPARTLDLTDIMVQAAGAVVGWILVRRAGFRPYGELAPQRTPSGARPR